MGRGPAWSLLFAAVMYFGETATSRRAQTGAASHPILVLLLAVGALSGFSRLGISHERTIAGSAEGHAAEAELELTGRGFAAVDPAHIDSVGAAELEPSVFAGEAPGVWAATEVELERGSLICEHGECRYERGPGALKRTVEEVLPMWIGYGAGVVAGRLAWAGPVGIAAAIGVVAGGYVLAESVGPLGRGETAAHYAIGVGTGAALGTLLGTQIFAGTVVESFALVSGIAPVVGTVAAFISNLLSKPQDEVAKQIARSGAIEGERFEAILQRGDGDLRSRLRSAADSELRPEVLQLQSNLLDLGHAEAARFVLEAVAE